MNKVICSLHKKPCVCVKYSNGYGFYCGVSKCKHKAFIQSNEINSDDVTSVLVGNGDYIIKKEIIHGY